MNIVQLQLEKGVVTSNIMKKIMYKIFQYAMLPYSDDTFALYMTMEIFF